MHRVLVFAFLALFAANAHAQRIDPLHAAVDAYASYQNSVSTSLDAEISSAEAMDALLTRAAQYDAAQLARGRIAYAALTAAQSPAFVAGVQARVRAAGRAPVLRQLQRDPTYARRRPPGAHEAIDLVLGSMTADVARLHTARAHCETLARSISGAPWATPLDPASRDARDQHLRALAGQAPLLGPELAPRVHVTALAGAPLQDHDAFGGAAFWDALSGRARLAAVQAFPRLRGAGAMANVIDRALTLGALYVLHATSTESARVTAMLDDPPARACLALQQLELRQCVSVSHTPDEDAFCLARHGPGGVGDCLGAMLQ